MSRAPHDVVCQNNGYIKRQIAWFAPRARNNPPNVYFTALGIDGIITESMLETLLV